jgi:hypothetical protein
MLHWIFYYFSKPFKIANIYFLDNSGLAIYSLFPSYDEVFFPVNGFPDRPGIWINLYAP